MTALPFPDQDPAELRAVAVREICERVRTAHDRYRRAWDRYFRRALHGSAQDEHRDVLLAERDFFATLHRARATILDALEAAEVAVIHETRHG